MNFAFNGSALAAGAEIEFGDAVITIPSLGSLMLSPEGGQGRAAVSNYFSQELKIGEAESKVAGRKFIGEKGEPRFATWSSVVMKDVHVFDKVHVGEMGTALLSTRGLEDEDDHEFDLYIWFQGVQVGKRKIHIQIDEGLRGMKRYRELQAHLRQEGAVDELAKRHSSDPSAAKKAAHELAKCVDARKPVCVSLVQRIDGWETKALATIPVRGLGTFRFGELMLKPGQRRINLIRATFGDAENGNEAPRMVMHALSRNAPNDADTTGDADSFDESTTSGEPPAPKGGSMILGSGEGNGTPIGP